MIQIKIESHFFGAYYATSEGFIFGCGETIQEAIEDFLSANHLMNNSYKWS
jgi:hypothetical protein